MSEGTPESTKHWNQLIQDASDDVSATWALFQLGDTAFTDSGHHGEPELRHAMVRAGFETADNDVKEAFNQGMIWAHLERYGGRLE